MLTSLVLTPDRSRFLRSWKPGRKNNRKKRGEKELKKAPIQMTTKVKELTSVFLQAVAYEARNPFSTEQLIRNFYGDYDLHY